MLISFVVGDAKVPNANGFASQWNIGFNSRKLTYRIDDSSFMSFYTIFMERVYDNRKKIVDYI